MVSCRSHVVVPALVLWASVAVAGEGATASGRQPRPVGPANALEVSIAGGSAQAYGYAERDGAALNDMGGQLVLSVGWRIDRRWMVGAYGAVGAYSSRGAEDIARTAGAGLQVERHFTPSWVDDVWVGVGLGWREHLGSRNGPTESHHGLDVARLRLGFDSPLSPFVSVSPVVGATLTAFLSKSGGTEPASTYAQGRGLSVSLFAGLLARFDLGARAGGDRR